jgi:hypothetical protein
LYCISGSAEGNAILEEFKHLLWPSFHKELFIDGTNRRLATFLDIYHPVRHLHERHIKDKERPTVNGTLFQWQPDDPMKDVLLATFGAFPTNEEIGKDYGTFFREYLATRDIEIGNNAPIPAVAVGQITPSALTTADLRPVDYARGYDTPGFYHGSSADFTDLVNFWNLRACGIEVMFYDPAFPGRVAEVTDTYLADLRARPKDPSGWQDHVTIWNKSYDVQIDLARFGQPVMRSQVSTDSWNGLNLKPALMGFEEHSILGTVSEEGRVAVTFELPEKPFFDDATLHTQNVVVSVHPLVPSANLVLKPPFLPQLNEYYGREAYFLYNAVRSERDGIGIITEVTTNTLTIRALDVRVLVRKIFETFGITASSSPAGLVVQRLIEQMGGLQGCRVFKIGGVRQLIRDYPPDKSFTRSNAIMTIRQEDSASGHVGFSQHERLFIEARERGNLKPEDAFHYLLKKGVFRVGLRLLCPNCELDGWVPLDDVRTLSRCEYCGKDFNITPQLRDRDWAYRRSGLFGRDDHQGGGIPVALTLQQLETALHSRSIAYKAGTELVPDTARIQRCETDFVLLAESPREKALQIAIGESKGRKEITEDDARHMGLVADALEEGSTCEPFIVFSKTSAFTLEEVERCRLAQGRYRLRVILLSDRELEPYFLYERAAKEFEIRTTAISFEDMAQATQNIYFHPVPKVVPAPVAIAPDAPPAG